MSRIGKLPIKIPQDIKVSLYDNQISFDNGKMKKNYNTIYEPSLTIKEAVLKHKHNLAGASLANADLSGLDLTGANLEDVNLCNANLTGANLTNANLKNADLTGANLYDAVFTGANLDGADFTKSEHNFFKLLTK